MKAMSNKAADLFRELARDAKPQGFRDLYYFITNLDKEPILTVMK